MEYFFDSPGAWISHHGRPSQFSTFCVVTKQSKWLCRNFLNMWFLRRHKDIEGKTLESVWWWALSCRNVISHIVVLQTVTTISLNMSILFNLRNTFGLRVNEYSTWRKHGRMAEVSKFKCWILLMHLDNLSEWLTAKICSLQACKLEPVTPTRTLGVTVGNSQTKSPIWDAFTAPLDV